MATTTVTKTVAQFAAARRAATPLIVIQTTDPAATMLGIRASFNGSAPPILSWDIVRGIMGFNKAGEDVANGFASPANILNPVDCLMTIESAPGDTLVFMHNMHRVITDTGVSQGVWNLRDCFKRTGRTLVMMCPSLQLPIELEHDVLVIDEPLPNEDQLKEIITDVYKSAQEADPSIELPPDLTKQLDAVCGLAAFPVEQSCAMAMTKKGMNNDWLWERKRREIEKTQGLSIHRGSETFDAVGGCDNVKEFMQSLITGKEPPRAIVFQDEIEKQMSGAGSDTSGVKSELHGIQLVEMQNKRSNGSIFVGVSGGAKSLVAKAVGNMAGIPTIILDLGATQSSLVGESGQKARHAFKVIDSISQGRAFFIATCNSIDSISPELRRRFKSATFFFDLPTADERHTIWDIYLRKFQIPEQNIPNDSGWTGAEIEQCCDLAWRLDIELERAADYIVPVAKSDADRIKRLRQQADGKFVSAAYGGPYKYVSEVQSAGRRLEL